jgi:starch synthase
MNILFTVSEIEGLVKTGGLADVAKYLPIVLNHAGHDTRVIMPYYKDVARLHPASEKTFSFSIRVHIEYQVKIHQITHDNLVVYCVDIPQLFDRDGIYSDNYHAYDDNGERFSVFSMAVLDFIQFFHEQIQFKPDVIQCNDWHTALLPALFKHDKYWQGQPTKTMLTIHNGAFQGISAKHSVPSLLSRLGEHHHEYENDVINFLKLGISSADSIVAVSPNYAEELKSELGSHHLFDIFNHNKDKVFGVLNGCDYKDWDPLNDGYIEQNYDIDSLTAKHGNKLALQKRNNLEIDATIPMVAMVSRLTDQKGLNYLLPAIRELVQHKIQICIAGTGDPLYVDQLEYLAKKHSDKVHFYHGFSEEIAHQYMAAADYFLVPSLFEPCGLTQMYALAYGTLPIVREVGGLKDTVNDISSESATGIVFKSPNCEQLVAAIRRGLLFYHEDPSKFRDVQKKAMSTKFLWQESAEQYIEIYKKMFN